MLSRAFTADQRTWPAASPARFDPAAISARIADGKAPRLVVLDQSDQDQLVPVSQRDRLAARLKVAGMRVVEGHRCTGEHAAPWAQGSMIWQSLSDILKPLGEE
jgi:kynurenine formamidase